MRVALGCMRLSTEPDRSDARAAATLEAALAAGIVRFDTARAYGLGDGDEGHNERLLARALGARRPEVRIVTKCGMSRAGGGWTPDGRAARILEDAGASAEALGGPPDVLLIHAPDPRVAWRTSLRALAKAREKGLAKAVGVSNVSRKQLEEALEVAPIAAVEIALGAYDDLGVRNGVAALCLERGIELLAHAPLGGARRVGKLARDAALGRVAGARADLGPVGIALAYVLAVHPGIVPVVGASRPETIAKIAAAARVSLDERELASLDERFPVLASLRRPPEIVQGAGGAEVVLMMGIPGAGKSSVAARMAGEGWERLNRDAIGGTLRGIAKRLDERLAAGATRIVLDNTYVTRATRHDVMRVARRHRASVRCIHFDTPAVDAQINAVLRMIERFGRVLPPAELARASSRDAAALAPNAIFRMTRELEAPHHDEGFASIEVIPFVRAPSPGVTRPALVVDRRVVVDVEGVVAGAAPEAAVLLFAWRPGAGEEEIAAAAAEARALSVATGRVVESAVCPHPAGPPVCWCRPPLPALVLEFAHRHAVDLRASAMVATSASDHAMAKALGMSISRP
ncbi:MAG: aldo/keto reductase [Deltaproteobacteria bacterium]|nr:aldo/keto reductase [Deltaproteobacteria bacterium]